MENIFSFFPKGQGGECGKAYGRTVGIQLLDLHSHSKSRATQVIAVSTPKSLYILLWQHETFANIKAKELFAVREHLGKELRIQSYLCCEPNVWSHSAILFPDPLSPCCPGEHCGNCTAQESFLLRLSISYLVYFVATQSSVCAGFPDLCFCRAG